MQKPNVWQDLTLMPEWRATPLRALRDGSEFHHVVEDSSEQLNVILKDVCRANYKIVVTLFGDLLYFHVQKADDTPTGVSIIFTDFKNPFK